MSGIAIAWAVVSAVVLFAAAWGVSVMGVATPDYLQARVAFTIAAVAFGSMTVVWAIRSNEPRWWRVLAPVLVGLVVFVAYPAAMRWTWVAEREKPENVGSLVASKTLERADVVFSADASSPLLLEIGDSGATFGYSGPQGQPLFRFIGASDLLIERIDGRLCFSTKIRDRDGRLVAELVRNDWKVSTTAWDRNYDDNALEVIDPYGNVALQIQVLPDRIRLQGEWWDDKGGGMRFVKSADAKHPGAFIVPLTRSDYRAEPHIERMFVYPSDKNFRRLAHPPV